MAVTLTVTRQVLFAGTVPPERVIESVTPLVQLTVPPHCNTVGSLAIFNPAGNGSVNPMPVKSVVRFGFVIVIVIVLKPSFRILVGRNALLMIGGAITSNVSVAVFPSPPLVEVTFSLVFV